MIREILCIYGVMKLSKEFRFFTYLLESYAQHKNTTAGAVLKTLDEKGLTDFVYKMYDLYHVEAIENAYMDLDSLMAQALAVEVDAVILESHRNWVDNSPIKSFQLSAKYLAQKF